MRVTPSVFEMKIALFEGLRPFNSKAVLRDALAGVTLASVNIPQVLGSLAV